MTNYEFYILGFIVQFVLYHIVVYIIDKEDVYDFESFLTAILSSFLSWIGVLLTVTDIVINTVIRIINYIKHKNN